MGPETKAEQLLLPGINLLRPNYAGKSDMMVSEVYAHGWAH